MHHWLALSISIASVADIQNTKGVISAGHIPLQWQKCPNVYYLLPQQ